MKSHQQEYLNGKTCINVMYIKKQTEKEQWDLSFSGRLIHQEKGGEIRRNEEAWYKKTTLRAQS